MASAVKTAAEAEVKCKESKAGGGGYAEGGHEGLPAGKDQRAAVAAEETAELAADAGESKEALANGDKKKKKKIKKGKDEVSRDDEKEEEKEDEKEEPSNQEQLMQMLRRTRICEESRRHAIERSHPFWDTQPVPQMAAREFEPVDTGPIDAVKSVEEVRPDPYPLPDAFEWCTCEVDNDHEAQEIYALLSENYVEDDDNMFRFDYSISFLRWALKPPDFLRDWHLGVRVKSNKKLVGFITAIPASIQAQSETVNMVEINFLCVHKKLRAKRLAPVLIKEITRRVNKQGIWQAVYTAGVVLPRPVSECRYYHRSLNPKKLIEVGFSHLGPRMTMARTIKLYKLPDHPQLHGMRPMEEKDIKRVFELVSGYLKKFPLHPEFRPEELAHWMLPRENVVYSFVREVDGEVADVCSFYSLPSNILGHDRYNLLKAAYSYWNVATTCSLQELMHDALIYAKMYDFDVFNALNVMENDLFLKDLKFGIGDGFLQYYLYNWKCPKIEPGGIGLVLL